MAKVQTKKMFSRTPPVPLTVHQLRRLQPHQKLVFYKGELDRDIESNGELPAYVQTLRAIKQAAEATRSPRPDHHHENGIAAATRIPSDLRLSSDRSETRARRSRLDA